MWKIRLLLLREKMIMGTINIPDNLDLADRARLGLHGLIGTCDPELDYEPYFLTYYSARPAYFLHWSTMVSGVKPKFLEAFALLKCICGTPDTDQEKAFLRSFMDNIDEDGLLYDKAAPNRPWNVGVGYGVKSRDMDYANIAGNGRLVNGLWYMYQLTSDESYKTAMKRCAEKMVDIAVIKNDYAYYPDSKCGNDFSWIKSGWPHTDEPKGPQEGCEGSVTFYQLLPVRGLMKWYYMSGDERMLDLSKRLVKFATQPKFYGGVVDTDPSYGAERAHWWGHQHGNLAAFRGIMDYACAASDVSALEFVRDAYEWHRQGICPQLGQSVTIEGCCGGDLPALAIQLTDAGIGDYWDDADHFVRNLTAQVQVTDLEGIRRIGESYAERPKDARFGAPDDFRFTRSINIGEPIPGLECLDNVLGRSVGAIANFLSSGRYQSPNQMACCTGNGLQGFYYAWEAAIRHSGGVSSVNLLFTRFSEWMDLISYLPYEGKVFIRNKTSKVINVRIPGGVPLNQARVTVNGNAMTPVFCGRYVSLTGLCGGEEIVVTFPQTERKLTLSVPNLNGRLFWGYPKVTANFVGSTCIGLEDEGESQFGSESVLVRQFNEPKYWGGETVYKDASYYVPPKVVQWY